MAQRSALQRFLAAISPENPYPLARPIEEYSPRSQRRYAAAAERGITPKQVHKEEYQRKVQRRRPTGGNDDIKLRAYRLARDVAKKLHYKPGVTDAFSRATVDRVASRIGYPRVIDHFKKQLDSINDYRETGNPRGGRALNNTTTAPFFEPTQGAGVISGGGGGGGWGFTGDDNDEEDDYDEDESEFFDEYDYADVFPDEWSHYH